MELLDRYLQAVRKHLPWQRQDDIIAELRANLESQLEDKQEELGRPLMPAEAEEWIGGLGSPVQMAAHYQPQQYLIGPAIYPVYLYILRLASMWAIVVYIVVSTVTIVLSSTATGDTIAQAAFRLPFVLIQVAAWVTAAFAAIEYFAVRYPDKCPPQIAGLYAKWSPKDLPPLQPPAAGGKKRRSYGQAVAEVIFGFIFLAWLVLVPRYPYLMFGPGAAYVHASPFRFAPILWIFYWWVVGFNALQLAWQCIDLLRGAWQHKDPMQHIVFKALSLIPIVYLLNVSGHVYVLLRHPDVDMARYGQTVNSFNQGIHSCLMLVCAIAVLQLAWDVGRRFFDGYRNRSVDR
jgi:hypothetical protein